MDLITKSNFVACTIVSSNYIPYARTLCESFHAQHPQSKFYVLLVDRNTGELDFSDEQFDLIEVQDLGIPKFLEVAFQFNIMELNTNVKPTFLKYLFNKTKVQKLIYFDPDIYIYKPLTLILDILQDHGIVLTPHATQPIKDAHRPAERDFLLAGSYNLGFIALANTIETNKFLDWWEKICLTLGFAEPANGYFVDQKWINLVPCYFETVFILKHPGCNMAYWNLHERRLSKNNIDWIVNEDFSLIFFHFSGINPLDKQQISKYQNRYDFMVRRDLIEIFDEYRQVVLKNGYVTYSHYPYYYSSYSTNEPISLMARRLYAINKINFTGNPFDSANDFYKWAKKRNLITSKLMKITDNSTNYNESDYRVRLVNMLLKLTLRILGVEKYSLLMKYLAYISILRNQKFI